MAWNQDKMNSMDNLWEVWATTQYNVLSPISVLRLYLFSALMEKSKQFKKTARVLIWLLTIWCNWTHVLLTPNTITISAVILLIIHWLTNTLMNTAKIKINAIMIFLLSWAGCQKMIWSFTINVLIWKRLISLSNILVKKLRKNNTENTLIYPLLPSAVCLLSSSFLSLSSIKLFFRSSTSSNMISTPSLLPISLWNTISPAVPMKTLSKTNTSQKENNSTLKQVISKNTLKWRSICFSQNPFNIDLIKNRDRISCRDKRTAKMLNRLYMLITSLKDIGLELLISNLHTKIVNLLLFSGKEEKLIKMIIKSW